MPSRLCGKVTMTVLRRAVFPGAAITLAMICVGASADTIYLTGGSELKGSVQTLDADTLKLDTDFAGTLALDRDKIAGVATGNAIPVVLDNGNRTKARFGYDADSGSQRVILVDGATSAGTRQTTLERVAGIRPRQIAEQKHHARLKKYTLPQYTSDTALGHVEWSGAGRLGINGSSGNSDSFNLLASLAALRETGLTRLDLLVSVNRATSGGDTTEASYLARAGYERDWSRHWYSFVKQSLERDRFQDYGLRSRTSFGVGYFVARQRRTIFKVQTGLGYEYTNYYQSSAHDSALIASAGWHYGALFGDYLKLTHDFDIYPKLTNSPAENFSLKSVLAVSVPIADSSMWAISAQVKNEYNNSPREAETDKLNTIYSLAIQRSF